MRSFLSLAAAFACLGCGSNDSRWVTVARDANYVIAIDTSRIDSAWVAPWGRRVDAYYVWYRTDHASPRLHRGKPFDRETVESIVRCDSLWFKVRRVDMSLGDRTIVSRQHTSDLDLAREQWRRVESGTSEEVAATAACHFGSNLRERTTRARRDS